MISHFVPIWNMWRVPRFSVTFASQWRNCSAGNRWKQIGGQCTERDEKEYHQGRNGDILKRVKEVKRVEDSRRVVENLLREGYPIAVDLEGISGNHKSSCTGLVSIKDVHGNFTFFRPRRNPALYQEGGLATLLESHHVLKIMHASGGDASSLYRDGVKLWNVFDTEVAHRVLEFQINGASLTNFQAIGLNNLCAYCGIESNPLKGKIKFNPWNERNVNENKNVMSEEFLLYSAWDVEQLHEIHQILRYAMIVYSIYINFPQTVNFTVWGKLIYIVNLPCMVLFPTMTLKVFNRFSNMLQLPDITGLSVPGNTALRG